ncbi:hypothetical protein [Seonamhaeicola marinus]|uniref:Lipocalin-like domain-containing protein n=1 Tax=Seonamhaeicola marinus TaxID=1912246 RepID=A0A5D0IK99_9FLAO|nr:hypothetical protein [Seonamhaeicola marinus]TYA84313.1 hypothetical protein FUA24_06615 [Seonamhaeicola marinus]
MKNNIFLISALLILIFSCNNTEKKDAISMNTIEETAPSLVGTWERTSYYNYVDGAVTDTFHTSPENRHIKVFTDSKVMWCRFIPSDSSDWFGYGNYNVKDNILTEILDYGSKTMSVHIANDSAFVFNLTLTDNTFSQVRIDDEGHPVFAENYVRLE